MKLRSQFILLDIFTGFAAIAATAALVIFASHINLLTGPGREMISVRERLEAAVDHGAERAELQSILEESTSLKLLLEDSDFRLLASNFPEAARLASGEPAEIARNFGEFFMNRIGGGTEEYYLVAIQLTPGGFYSSFITSTAPFVVLFLAILLLLPFLASFRLNRTLKAIKSLQLATERVAAGDLEYSPIMEGPEEIVSLAHSFDAMRLALRDESDRRARFLMSISHDLKTPLASVRGYVEALRDGHAEDSGRQEHYLSIIDQKSMLLESRIRELVNFASLSTSDWQLTLRPVRLREFFSGIAEAFREEASVFGRIFAATINIPDDVTAMMDEQLFTRTLENLFSNSLKFTHDGGRIELDCYTLEGFTDIAFSDDGPGIADADKPYIFEAFYRGDKTRTTQGMGLGLAIAKSITEAHGFSISVRDTQGPGTVIVIRIPHCQG
jgi:signal transduction histidine kinase